MRLDKFLKVSRIIKRRPLAKQIAEENRIHINDVAAKPSAVLEVGDIVAIRFAQKVLTVKVLRLQEHVKKEAATDMYEVVEEEKISSQD